MRGQLSAEMLILIVVVLAVVAIVASQLLSTAKKGSEEVKKTTEELWWKAGEIVKGKEGDPCEEPDHPCEAGLDCIDGYCVKK